MFFYWISFFFLELRFFRNAIGLGQSVDFYLITFIRLILILQHEYSYSGKRWKRTCLRY